MSLKTSLRDLVGSAESLVYVEDLSGKKGLLQSINPLVKLVVTVLMIVGSLFVSQVTYMLLACAIPLFLALTSRIPFKDFLTRTAFIPVFAAIIALPILFITAGTPILSGNLSVISVSITMEGLQKFLLFTVRVWFCVASLSLLIMSTGFNSFLKLLSTIHVPSIVIQLFSLTYRYLFVSIHEIQSILIGKEARTYINKKRISFQALKHSGSLLASIFIRTFERSERVYMAMKARGFDVNNANKESLPPMHIKDGLFAALAIIVFLLCLCL
jgi:cobalt/nickel transport system permease protein